MTDCDSVVQPFPSGGYLAVMLSSAERLYLDFDSFFAAAEQHFNVALRGRPVGVVPLDSPHTGCIAISREAKVRGLKGNASIRDARRLIPEMVFVVARHDVYVRLHNRIVEIVDTCVPVADVRSIDEMVCHLGSINEVEAKALSDRIKVALAQAFSLGLTCSIGIAPTELLAKVAAEMQKPDGFVYLDRNDLPGRLSKLDLTDLPGISDGMVRRLNAAGVGDVRSLCELAPKQARAIWRSVEGERFLSELTGTHVSRPKTEKRMFGHSRKLPADWRNAEKMRICARQLLASAARRLRRADLRATRLTLLLRGRPEEGFGETDGQDFKWSWEGSCLPARDDHTFLDLLSEGLRLAESQARFRPRAISVLLHGLMSDDQITSDLFGDLLPDERGQTVRTRQDQNERISDLMDALRKSHGPTAISLGPHQEIPGGYLGAKIAFGRIPDVADFDTAPVQDEKTHFCTSF
jgi:DNA polymerase-4